VIRSHSAATFVSPRNAKRRKPRTSLRCLNTGSTIALRYLYTACPAVVCNFCRIWPTTLASVAVGAARVRGGALPCFCRSGGT
jgi:hypothetical protein